MPHPSTFESDLMPPLLVNSRFIGPTNWRWGLLHMTSPMTNMMGHPAGKSRPSTTIQISRRGQILTMTSPSTFWALLSSHLQESLTRGHFFSPKRTNYWDDRELSLLTIIDFSKEGCLVHYILVEFEKKQRSGDHFIWSLLPNLDFPALTIFNLHQNKVI